jgi:hypothetical protein
MFVQHVQVLLMDVILDVHHKDIIVEQVHVFYVTQMHQDVVLILQLQVVILDIFFHQLILV